MVFATKFKAAIIFLVIILAISLLLILIYLLLKRGMCCDCFGQGKGDDEEGFYDDAERDEYDTIENGAFEVGQEEDEELPPPVDELLPETPPIETSDNEIPEVVVTEAEFIEPKKRKSHIHSIFKKLKKPLGRVRFEEVPPSEQTSLMETGSNSYNNSYGIQLAPLRRSDSMESFMSGLSSVTTTAEEFGDELSPSRLQIFIQYEPKTWVLTMGCKQADYLITADKATMYWQVHMTLLPFKKHRFKTRYKSSSTPVFNQNFEVDNIPMQSLTQMSVRYRIYGRTGRAGKKKLAGETEVELAGIVNKAEIKEWRTLKRKNQGGKR